MDEDKVERILKSMSQIVVNMQSDLLKLQASVTVLQITVATLAGKDPEEFVAQLRDKEQRALAGVSASRQLQELTEVVKFLNEHGKSFGKNQA